METRERTRPLAEALRNLRYEVIPLAGVEAEVLRHVPREITLTVTASPVKGIEATLELTERLAGAGYRVVPHLAARLVRDEEHLAEILERLRVLEVRQLFVIAGDAEEPAGKFEGAGALLKAMAGSDFKVGISGYPESHPIISDEATIQAMFEKAPYAAYIVSQICFDPGVIRAWIRAVRERGVYLPIYVGMPGPVSNQKLLRISARIGLGESARFLQKHSNWLLRMFLPGGYRPDRLIRGLEPALEDPQAGIRGFHIYTFNELGRLERWRRKQLERLDSKY
jgi:methylenetetrahydrofolate reductase (NADPH)